MATARLLGVTLLVTLGGLTAAQGPADDREPAYLLVYVPPAATLTVEDTPTKQTGPERQFASPPLARGKTYRYTLKATWRDAGREVVRMAVVRVQAGKEVTVDLREGSKDGSSSQIVYVPTAESVVDKMLELAGVTRDDVVYDLGCGDGRIVVRAAKKYGAHGVGVDIDKVRVKEARANVEKAGIEKLVTIRHGDALKVPDLSRATVVALYMLPEFMEKLEPIVKKELKPGARIVAHDYPFPKWKADLTYNMPGVGRLFPHTLYVWKVGGAEKK
jgi:uncharacterized protein (TIGR03000 family)